MRSLFLRSLSKYGSGDIIGSKRVQTCISCTNGDRKMKVNTRGKFEVKYLFSKPLSQNCEVLTPRSDVINPKMGQKGPDLYFISHC